MWTYSVDILGLKCSPHHTAYKYTTTTAQCLNPGLIVPVDSASHV